MLIALLASLSAAASQGYLDYFFRQPPIADTSLASDFNRALADLDSRQYQKADEDMTALLGKTDASGITAAAKAQLLADAGILKAYIHQPDKALPLLQQSVSIIETSVHRLSPLLFNPSMAAGMIQSQAGNYHAAMEMFRRAQHVLHVQDGVYTREQVPVLDQLTRINQMQGLLLNADRQQRFEMQIAERAYGANSEALIPTLEKVARYFRGRGGNLPQILNYSDANANWLSTRVPSQYLVNSNNQFSAQPFWANDVANARFLGNPVQRFRKTLFDEAVGMYNRAIKILEAKYGPNDLRLVDPLKQLSRTRLVEGGHKNLAEAAMERATKIVRDNPETDVEDHINALVQLGDLYIITGDSRAQDRYLQAWRLVNTHPELSALKAQLFGKPTRIYPVTRSIYLNQRPREAVAGEPLYTTLKFTVDDNGMPRDIKVIDGNIPMSSRNNLVRFFQKSVKYRPRVIDNGIVETNGVLFRQKFVTDTTPTVTNLQTSSTGEH